jgi:hypothetical protein
MQGGVIIPLPAFTISQEEKTSTPAGLASV